MKKASTKKDFPVKGRIDLARVASITEKEIMQTSPPELSDLPDDFWDNAALVMPEKKVAVSLRMDSDVLAWYKATGPRYQTRMNAVLKSYAKWAATV